MPTGQVSYAYDTSTGRLTTVTAPGGSTVSYSYDGGLVTSESWAGPITGSVTRTYDNDLRIASQSVNSGDTVTFLYDPDSLLTQAGEVAVRRDPQNGLLVGTTLGNVTTTWSYNGFGEVTDYAASANTAPLLTVAYTYDKLGRLVQKVETIGGITDSFDYIYDLAGRLTETKKNGVVAATYTYDSNGNRVSFTGPGGTVTGIYDAQDRLTQYGATTYTYTANGELLGKTAGGQSAAYQYDVRGNLLAVTLPGGTQVEYLVDGRNRRIGKKLNGTLLQGFLYQGRLKLVAELDGNNTLVSRFIYATRRNVPDYMVREGATYRMIADRVGSVRLVVESQTGVIAQRLDYDEFGRVVTDTNPGFQPFGFAGGLYDPDTRLTRFGARDYDAETGRWSRQGKPETLGMGDIPRNWLLLPSG